MGKRDLPIPFIDSLTVFLILVNVGFFVWQLSKGDPQPFMASQEVVFEQEVYRNLITYSLFHSDLSHIGFNMFALLFYGLIIEKELGKFKLAVIYLAGVLGGSLLHISLKSNPVLGASAATYLLKTVTVLLYPTEPLYKYISPIKRITDRIPLPIVSNLFTVLGLTSLSIVLPLTGIALSGPFETAFVITRPAEGIFSNLMSFSQGGAKGVSNAAHIGGILVGMIMAYTIDSERMIQGLKLTSLFIISFLLLKFEGMKLIGTAALLLVPLFMHKIVPRQRTISKMNR